VKRGKGERVEQGKRGTRKVENGEREKQGKRGTGNEENSKRLP
jgi:hypothetical protein